MKITILPANNGDSFLLETDHNNILIDGGYVNTYKEFLKPIFQELNRLGKKINHLVVTHIDKDHISGIIKLIAENSKNSIIEIENIWHNSYNHLKSIEDGISFLGKPIDSMTINYELKEENVEVSDIDISAVQGSTLASLLRKNGFESKDSFIRDNYISFDNSDVIFENDLTFRILSPNNEKLLELKKYWKRELYTKGYSSDEELTSFNEDVFEYILSQEKEKKKFKRKNINLSTEISIENLLKDPFVEDDSPTNGSSIAFVLEYKDLKFLFLADSHPSLILENLMKHYSSDEFPIKFDLIKISHHGSKSNTSPELLKFIDSENYVISTNGLLHNHPDLETIARIIHRETTFTRKLYFNYELDVLTGFLNEDLEKKYNYRIIQNKTKKPISITF